MEKYYQDHSVNSVLLLKERIIKVETLLNKYTCLATKFNELEKSHCTLAESEKNAKKDAARYLEKYCERSKKCLVLLKRIKSLEKEVKEKIDLTVQYQSDLEKLDSILRIYKIEREDFLNLRKDKEFLLSLVWKLVKDNELESRGNKNKKNVEIFFKRFERDLENLKLYDFQSRKRKKISKSQGEEVETSSFSVELPVMSSVESGFIDGDGGSESANSPSSEEIDCIGQRVSEFLTKPNDECADGDSNINSIAKIVNYSSMINNGLFEPSNSEKCIKIQTEDFCFDVYSSINEDLTNCNKMNENNDGFTINLNESSCSSVSQERINATELTKKSDLHRNENGCNIDEKGGKYSEAVENNKSGEIQSKSSDYDQPRNCLTSIEEFDCITAMENPHSSSKQYKNRTSKHLCNSSTMNDATNPVIKCAYFPFEIDRANFDGTGESSKSSINQSFDKNKADINKIESTMNGEKSSLVVLGENKTSNNHIGRSENEKTECEKISQDLNTKLDHVGDEKCVREKQKNCFKSAINKEALKCLKRRLEEENFRKCQKVDNPKCISNKEMSLETKMSHSDSSRNLSDVEVENLSSAKYTDDIPDEKIFQIFEMFRPVKLISPIKEIEERKDSKRAKLSKSSGRLTSPTYSINDKLNAEAEKVQTEKETKLISRNESVSKSLIDASTQTNDVIIIESNSAEGQVLERNVRSKNNETIPMTKSFIKKVVGKILNSKLKNKLKKLNELTKFLKFHHCSNPHLKAILNLLNVHNVCNGKCEKEILCSILEKCSIMRYKKKKAVKKRLSAWKVEDSIEIGTVLNQNQYLSGFSGKNNIIQECSIYNDLTKMQNNKFISSNQLSRSENRDWMTNWGISYNTPKGIFESSFPNSSSESLLREISLKTNFKEEDDGFGSLSIDNYSVFNKPVDRGDSDVLDVKDKCIPAIRVEQRLIIPENNDQDKSEFNYKNSIGNEVDSLHVQKCTSVPKKSSQIANTSPNSETLSPPTIRNKLDILNENNKSSNFEFSEEIGHCQNSDSALEHQESTENFTPIFQETVISEPAKISEDLDQTQRKADFAPKVPCNLQKKIGNNVDRTFKCSNPNSGLVKKKVIRNARNFRTSNKLTTKMVEDSYYSEEENEKGETHIAEPEKSMRRDEEIDMSQNNAAMALDARTTLFTPEKEMSEGSLSSYNSFGNASLRKYISDYSKSVKSNDEKCGEVVTVCFNESDEKRKTETEESEKKLESVSLLDSIMTAMTKQAEEFKPKISVNKGLEKDISEVNPLIAPPATGCRMPPFTSQKEMCDVPVNSFNEASHWNYVTDCSVSEKLSEEECSEVNTSSSTIGNKLKKIIKKLLENYLNAEYRTVEEMEAKMKPCLAAMNMANENDLASIIVSEVMDNSHEELVNFERPAPPLTRIEHRLIVLLAVLPNTYKKFSKIWDTTLRVIWSRLFPDTFVYSDDEIEAAARFYAAICRKLNNFKVLWRFCYEVIPSMRQRWSIPIFVIFQVWPDILHNAKYAQDNFLVLTFVNVILHTPKGENMRRKRQENKLLGIKHLLINFYEFEVNVTIEQFARRLFQAVHSDAPGIADALSFLAKCRQWTWNRKNIISPIIDILNDWKEGKLTDQCGFTIIKVIRKISTLFPLDEDNETLPTAKKVISSLYELLSLSQTNPEKEKMIIKTLCEFAHHSGVKDFLSQLLNKFSCHDPLHIRMKKVIQMSARKRKDFKNNLKKLRKREEKFRKKKVEQKKRKKKKKLEKKPTVKIVEPEIITSEITT